MTNRTMKRRGRWWWCFWSFFVLRKKEMVGEKKIQDNKSWFSLCALESGFRSQQQKGGNFRLPPSSSQGGGKKRKKEKKREEKRQLLQRRARQETPLVNTFRHKTTARTRITQQEKQQEYNKHDHKRRDRHHTGREQTQISRNERKEKEEKHFIERERSLKSARDLDVPRQKKKFKRENAESNRDTKKNKKK